MKKKYFKNLALGLTTFTASFVLVNKSLAVEALGGKISLGKTTSATNQTAVEPFRQALHTSISQGENHKKSTKTDNPVTSETSATVKISNLEVDQEHSESSKEVTSDDPMTQITNVSQLKDVQPTDWAFQSLSNIVQKYGCLQGYPDSTYRGNRALTRYEFAAGLNACLRQVEALISSQKPGISKEDLQTLQRLTEEFKPELATLNTRVDNLENRTAFVEKHQFSTTTRLNGEAIIGISIFFAGQDSTHQDIPRNTTFSDRIRLNFDTTFSGKDLLRTRLQALNFNHFSSTGGTNSRLPEGVLSYYPEFSEELPADNTLTIDTLYYRFPVGKKTNATVFANEGEVDDFLNTVNPYVDVQDGAGGALSKFGARNSIYYYVPQAPGIGIRHQLSDRFDVGLGYFSKTAADPQNGLFKGAYAAIGQIVLRPTERIQLGFTYVNSYTLNEDLAVPGTGSKKSNLSLVTDLPVVSNVYGVEASFQITSKFLINAWAMYAKSRVLGVGDADIWSYAGALVFPDLGGRGNVAGIIVGMEPKVTSANSAIADAFTDQVETQNQGFATDRDTSLHVEGFYTYQIADYITITPGIIWLTAPNHDARNDGAVMGVIRTTFFF